MIRKNVAALMVSVTFSLQVAAQSSPFDGGPQPTQSPQTPQQPTTPFDECMSNAGGNIIKGIFAGVIGGLLAGAKKGNSGESAVIGGVIGAIGGIALSWGKCYSETAKIKSEQVAGYAAAVSTTDYKPEKGTSLEIRNAFLDAPAVQPGEGRARLHALTTGRKTRQRAIAPGDLCAPAVSIPGQQSPPECRRLLRRGNPSTPVAHGPDTSRDPPKRSEESIG